MKRIIIEGADGTGKTTLISSLQAEFPNRLVLIRNSKEDKQDFDNWWMDELNYDHSPVVPIHDRFYYSELVYGPLLRGKINGKKSVHNTVRQNLRAEALLIYCRPTYSKIREGVQTNPQMEGVSDHLMEIVERYDKLMGFEDYHFNRRSIMYDYSFKSSYEAVVRRVKEYLAGELK